jgi:hypothetical protein
MMLSTFVSPLKRKLIYDLRKWQIMKIIRRAGGLWILGVLAVLIIGCEYFPESTFTLASESRLPGWITPPPGLTRGDLSLTMSYYVKPWGRSAQFILRDKNKQILKKEDGKMRCSEPFELKSPSQGFPTGYPAYEAITVDGITEIIEHRKMEPIFFITDDPAVQKHIAEIGCGQHR